MRIINVMSLVVFFASLVLLTACGGDGGARNGQAAKTVSGVAATGAPIVGAVTLTDGNGVQLGPLQADSEGRFSFDVTGLAAPYSLSITWDAGAGATRTLTSIAFSDGIANINPFSDLILQIASGTTPQADGASRAGKIAEVQAELRLLLSPLFEKYGIEDFDPIKGAFVAHPSNKLDALLDAISITSGNGTFFITSNLDGSTIVAGELSNMGSAAVYRENSPDPATMAEIRMITERLALLCAAINKGSTPVPADFEDFFVADPNYGTSSGKTRAQDIAGIIAVFSPSNPNGKLKSIRNVRLVRDLSSEYASRGVTNAYLINYDFIHENGTVVRGNNTTWAKETASVVWKLIGDPVGQSLGNNYAAFELISVSPSLGDFFFTFPEVIPVSQVINVEPIQQIFSDNRSEQSSQTICSCDVFVNPPPQSI